ncbi:MAG: glycoside hydrolase family 97 catalytic domain-containing protein [Pirellulales bacterium]
MRRPKTSYLRFGFFAAFFLASQVLYAQEGILTSPNQKVRFSISAFNGGLQFAIIADDGTVVERSPLIITVDGQDITAGVQFGNVKQSETKEQYPWHGVHSTAMNHSQNYTVALRNATTKTDFTIEVRAFDDGVAFRYLVPASDKPRVPDEATTFTLPAGSTVWHHDLEGHYEAVHKRSNAEDIEAGEWIAPPVTFKLPRDAGYASITEAALVNYSGMAFQADGRRGLKTVLGHAQHVSYPFRLRYKDDIERLAKPAAIDGAIVSPWRVVIIGRDLNTLVNSDIVHNLCPPPDPKLFPDGIKTDWIKPGRAVWRYLDGGRNTLEDMKEFSRMAGELGFEYHVIEGFWRRWSDEQIKELVDYSRERGVGLWFWRHSNALRTDEAREEFFKRLHDLGVVGAKIDFFDHEHREVVDHYTKLLETAAKHHILVNFHGSNKPTGEPRTWPNELVREGVRGMESSRLRDRARHDATLPFTRFLAGHADYTPVHFGARRADSTWAHQIATAVVFNAPLQTYGAHPKSILENPAAPMLKSIPSVWDETIVLDVSEIGELAAFARRSGKTWFVGVVNGPATGIVELPLSFLGAGVYQTSLVLDRHGDSAALDIKETKSQRRDVLKLELNSGGGAVARFIPGNQDP